jgi:hypothetical protein
MSNVVGLASFAVLLAMGQVLFKKVALGMRGLPLAMDFRPSCEIRYFTRR